MANLSEIYNWFMTGKKPTQGQFWASWGSFWNKAESIPQSAIAGLTAVLNAKAEKSQFDAHKTDENAHTALFAAKEDKTQKGVAGGYVPLDEFVKIANEYLTIVNDLVTGGSTSLASAETVKTLKTQIDGINTILTSNDVNLDTVQEVVDAIKTVQISLSTILVNDLTTGGTTKALTAEMGKTLKGLIDGLVVPTATDAVRGIVKTDVTKADPVVYTTETTDNLLKAKVNAILEIKPITGIAYTLIAYDTENLVQLAYDGTLPMTVTIPNDATLPLPIGSIFYTVGSNTGALTIAGGAGVSFQTAVGLTAGQNETRKYVKKAVNKWQIEGGVAATAATALEYKKCYLKSTGNDSNAVIGSGSSPFLTLEGLITKVLVTYGSFDDVEIIILDSGSYVINIDRTYSDFVIKTKFSPTVRIGNLTIVSRTLFLDGQMTLELNPIVGATVGTYLFSAPSGGNTSSYMDINAVTKGTQGYSPNVYFQSFGYTNWTLFKVVTISGEGRGFSFAYHVGILELNIDTLTGGSIEFESADPTTVIVNIRKIAYAGTGTYSPFNYVSDTNFTLNIGYISVTQATAKVLFSFRNMIINLKGGVFENTYFLSDAPTYVDAFGYITGRGTLSYKSTVALPGIISYSGGAGRIKNRYNNVLKDLFLTIGDTNGGAYLNGGAVIGVYTDNVNISYANSFVLENVTIVMNTTTCPIFFTGGALAESTTNWNILLKNAHFMNNGYLVLWRSGFSNITDATGRIIIAKIGGASYNGLGISNTISNLTIVDISN